METQDTQQITKRDVPPILGPAVVRIGLGLIVLWYIGGIYTLPLARPGLMEASIALMLGYLAHQVTWRSIAVYCTDLTIRSRTKRWLRWVGPFVHTPSLRHWKGQLLFGGVFFAGFALLICIFVAMFQGPTHVSWPWVHPGKEQAFSSLLPAGLIYFILLFAGQFVAQARWYYSLPD